MTHFRASINHHLLTCPLGTTTNALAAHCLSSQKGTHVPDKGVCCVSHLEKPELEESVWIGESSASGMFQVQRLNHARSQVGLLSLPQVWMCKCHLRVSQRRNDSLLRLTEWTGSVVSSGLTVRLVCSGGAVTLGDAGG